jgi:UPF0716 family protein affecting phage T7 exclusion
MRLNNACNFAFGSIISPTGTVIVVAAILLLIAGLGSLMLALLLWQGAEKVHVWIYNLSGLISVSQLQMNI